MKPIKRSYNLLEEELMLIKQLIRTYKKFDLKPNDIIRLGIYCTNVLPENEVEALAEKLPRFAVGRPKERKPKK